MSGRPAAHAGGEWPAWHVNTWDLRDLDSLDYPLGRRDTVTKWPDDAAWDFVAAGRGRDADYWRRFLDALHRVDPDIAVIIEHENTELGRLEGLEIAATTLREAAASMPRV